MTARRLDGRIEADRIITRLASRVARLSRRPHLAIVLVGSRFDSAIYVRLKRQAAKRVGIRTTLYRLPTRTSATTLHSLLKKLRTARTVDGILLQLPLPAHLSANDAIAALGQEKDVDGFHSSEHGVENPAILAVAHCVRIAHPRPKSKVVILGRDSVFTSRLAIVLRQQGFTSIVITRPTAWQPRLRQADIVVTARGTGPRITAADIKHNAILIDVGIRQQGKKTVGDVDVSAWAKAKAITPVPGGIGPMTIAYVLQNTYTLRQR